MSLNKKAFAAAARANAERSLAEMERKRAEAERIEADGALDAAAVFARRAAPTALDRVAAASAGFAAANPAPATAVPEEFAGANPAVAGAAAARFVTANPPLGEAARPAAAVAVEIAVPLDAIDDCPWNAAPLVSSHALAELVASIKEHGQQSPGLAYRKGGRYVLIYGHKRRDALRAIPGATTMRLQLVEEPASPRTVYEKSRTENVARSEHHVLFDANAWRRLLDAGVYESQEQLRLALGIEHKGHVSMVLALADLPRSVQQQAVDLGIGSLRYLYELSRLCEQIGEVATLAYLAQAAAREEITIRHVQARLKAAQEGPRAKPRSQPHPVRFGPARGEIKLFREDRRIELVLSKVAPEHLETVVECLRQALEAADPADQA